MSLISEFLIDLPSSVISRLYTFAIMWSVAAVLESDNRRLLEDFIKMDLRGKIEIPKLRVNRLTEINLISILQQFLFPGRRIDL